MVKVFWDRISKQGPSEKKIFWQRLEAIEDCINKHLESPGTEIVGQEKRKCLWRKLHADSLMTGPLIQARKLNRMGFQWTVNKSWYGFHWFSNQLALSSCNSHMSFLLNLLSIEGNLNHKLHNYGCQWRK